MDFIQSDFLGRSVNVSFKTCISSIPSENFSHVELVPTRYCPASESVPLAVALPRLRLPLLPQLQRERDKRKQHVTQHVVEKINLLARQSIKYFEEFLGTLKDR